MEIAKSFLSEVVPEEKNDQTKSTEDWCLTGKGTAAIEDQRKPKIPNPQKYKYERQPGVRHDKLKHPF